MKIAYKSNEYDTYYKGKKGIVFKTLNLCAKG